MWLLETHDLNASQIKPARNAAQRNRRPALQPPPRKEASEGKRKDDQAWPTKGSVRKGSSSILLSMTRAAEPTGRTPTQLSCAPLHSSLPALPPCLACPSESIPLHDVTAPKEPIAVGRYRGSGACQLPLVSGFGNNGLPTTHSAFKSLSNYKPHRPPSDGGSSVRKGLQTIKH